MSKEQCTQAREKYSSISRELVVLIIITYIESLTSLKKDYSSSLALEKRFFNIDNLNEYNRCLKALEGLFETSLEDLILLNTTSMNMNDGSIEIASQIMTATRKRYIKIF